MKHHKILIFFFFLVSVGTYAQKKKDLLNKIQEYSSQIKDLKLQLVSVEQKQRLAEDKIEKLELQNLSVEKEKKDLLKTISSFTSVSKQKADNLSTSLETIKEKDQQLKVINDALADIENNKLNQLTKVRDSLGTLGKVGFVNGILYLKIPNKELFGNDNYATSLDETGKKTIEKLGDFLKHYPQYNIAIEGNSNALNLESTSNYIKDNWDLSASQITAVAKILHNNCNINPQRITVIANAQYKTQGLNTFTNIIIQPSFDEFYKLIKETMK